MSEADTSQEPNKYQFLPEPIPVDAKIANMTDATKDNKAANQPIDLEDAARMALPQTLRVVTNTAANVVTGEASATLATNSDAMTDNVALMPAKEADWLALIQKLRQRNQGLSDRVTQLEQALSDSQGVLQSQKATAQTQDTILTKASQEIATAQEQIARLFREVELSHQVAQRQQILIETLTEQLEGSQQRMAQMERECALTQQRYNEQSHQLLQTENAARELRDRLNRQQRHTLQFKAALEKCLEVPTINYQVNSDPNSSVTDCPDNLNTIIADPSILPKAPPIQPWSAPPEISKHSSSILQGEEHDLNVEEDFFLQTVREQTIGNVSTPIWSQYSSSEDASDREAQPLDKVRSVEDKLIPLLSEFDLPPEVEEVSIVQTYEVVGEYDTNDLETESAVIDSELQQQIQDVLPELGWLSQLLNDPQVDLSPEIATVWVENSDSQADRDEDNHNTQSLQDIPPPNVTRTEAVVHRVDFEQRSPDDFNPKEHSQAILSQPNWPSPLVYPLRPSRGRKSLAAVELPTFPSGSQKAKDKM